MAPAYDVRLYSIEVRKDRPKPYRLRWLVGEREHSKSYTLKVQAEVLDQTREQANRRIDQPCGSGTSRSDHAHPRGTPGDTH
ncbi:hypothetical protein GCM10010234_35910 [Streptomyces hawaiiensis]